jgi:hypothetical protein
MCQASEQKQAIVRDNKSLVPDPDFHRTETHKIGTPYPWTNKAVREMDL